MCGEKIRRVIAQHQRMAKRDQRPSTPSLHLNKIYSTFTLWPTGACDSVVVEVLVDSLLGLLHQPTLASPVPTIRSVPHLLVLRGVQILFVTRGGATRCKKMTNPMEAVWPTPAQSKTSLGSDRLCHVLPRTLSRRTAVRVLSNHGWRTDASWKNANLCFLSLFVPYNHGSECC